MLSLSGREGTECSSSSGIYYIVSNNGGVGGRPRAILPAAFKLNLLHASTVQNTKPFVTKCIMIAAALYVLHVLLPPCLAVSDRMQDVRRAAASQVCSQPSPCHLSCESRQTDTTWDGSQGWLKPTAMQLSPKCTSSATQNHLWCPTELCSNYSFEMIEMESRKWYHMTSASPQTPPYN